MVGSADELVAHARSRIGLTLRGKYRLERVLGVGGMAAVYEATHRNGHRVALKMLHGVYSIRPEIRARFLREGHAANAVKHPGAVVVIDDDIAEDGSAYIVMELLDGEVVERLWARNACRLPPQLVLAIAFELCDVLAAAHRAGIVHRDIKPENLYLTRDGDLKVLDFGLAHLRDIGPKLTATGMVFGTPAFMAPEQASGRTSQIDAQSDVWAVGATMFTLLSGVTVHEGETGQHIIVLAATKPPRPLASVLPGVAPELATLVDGALTFEKSKRWANASVLQTAIRKTSRALFGASPDLRALVSDDATRVQLFSPSEDLGTISGVDTQSTPVRREGGLPNLASSGDSTLTDRRQPDTTEPVTPIFRAKEHAPSAFADDDAATLLHRRHALTQPSRKQTGLNRALALLGRFPGIARIKTASEAPTLNRRLVVGFAAFKGLAARLRYADRVSVLGALARNALRTMRVRKHASMLALVIVLPTIAVVVGFTLRRSAPAVEPSPPQTPLIALPSSTATAAAIGAATAPAVTTPPPSPEEVATTQSEVASSTSDPMLVAPPPPTPTAEAADASRPAPTTQRTTPKSTPPSSPPAPRSSECNPPYVVTPQGKVIWKTGCLSNGHQ